MSSAAHRTASAAPSHPNWTLAATVLASSLSFVDGSVLSVALPAIRDGYGAGAAEVQWVVNAYTLPLASLLLLGGALGDHFGRRRLLVIGTAIFALASLLCALAPRIELLLAARGLQGIGAALLLPNSLGLLDAAFAGEQRGRAVGIWAGAGAAAAAIAPLIGGWLVDAAGWPTIFLINLPLAGGAILLALRFVGETRQRSTGRTDYAGALLVTAGLGGIAYALTLWSGSGRLTSAALAMLAAGVVLLLVFLAVEWKRGARAMMPLAMFSGRCFDGLNLLTLLLYGAFAAALLLIPYVLIDASGYAPLEAGLALLPLPILLTFASPVMGRLAERLGPRIPLTLGPLVVASGMLLARRIGADEGYWTSAFPAILVMAVGMSIAVAPLTSAVLGSVEEQHVATASGLNSAVARLGGLLATALLGAVLAQHGAGLFAPFHSALLVAAMVAALAGLVALTMLGGVRLKRN